MITRNSLLVVLLFVTDHLFAALPPRIGTETGHGGTIINCVGKEMEALDSWEARVYRKLIPSMGEFENDPNIQATFVLKRLEKIDPQRAKLYLSSLESFGSESAVLINTELKPVNDWGYLPIPKDCEIKQVIWQVDPKFPGDVRYWIQGDIWNNLSNRNKAILILHEILYQDALKNGHEESTAVRYLNEIMTSTRAETLTSDQWKELLQATALDSAIFLTVLKENSDCEYFSPGKVAVTYFPGKFLFNEASSLCDRKGMVLFPSNGCVSDLIRKSNFFKSPLWRLIQENESESKIFWATRGWNIDFRGGAVWWSDSSSSGPHSVFCLKPQN